MPNLVPWEAPTLSGAAAAVYAEQAQKNPVRTLALTAVSLAVWPLGAVAASVSAPEIARRHKIALDEWLSRLPPQREVQIASRQELLTLLEELRVGTAHPRRLSITVLGPFSQVVSKAFNALYKARAVRRRGEMYAVGAAISAIGSVAKDYGASMAGYAFKEVGDALYLDDVVRAALILPSAKLVCVLMLAGLHQDLDNDGEVVRILDGEPPVTMKP